MIKPKNLMGVEKTLNHPVLRLIRLTAYQEVPCLFIIYPPVAPSASWHKEYFWVLYTHMDTSNGY